MIQPLVNALLGFGYIVGLFLVWVGMEMYVIDGRRFAPSVLSVFAGIALWAALVAIGKAVHRRAVRAERSLSADRVP